MKNNFIKNKQRNLLNNKKIFYITFIILFSILIINIFNSVCYGATPQLVSKMEDGFKNIQSWILRIATPAAAVAVGTGIFMKKFSFGEEERIRTGKKIIRGSLFSYAFILGIDLILGAIQYLI